MERLLTAPLLKILARALTAGELSDGIATLFRDTSTPLMIWDQEMRLAVLDFVQSRSFDYVEEDDADP